MGLIWGRTMVDLCSDQDPDQSWNLCVVSGSGINLKERRLMQGLLGFVGPIADESRSVDPTTENGLLLTTESKITWIRHNRELMLQFCEITQERLKFFLRSYCVGLMFPTTLPIMESHVQ